jgi:hypothetical protein
VASGGFLTLWVILCDDHRTSEEGSSGAPPRAAAWAAWITKENSVAPTNDDEAPGRRHEVHNLGRLFGPNMRWVS